MVRRVDPAAERPGEPHRLLRMDNRSHPAHRRGPKRHDRGERNRANLRDHPGSGAAAAAQVPARVGRRGQVIIAADGGYCHADAVATAVRVGCGRRAAAGPSCTDLAEARVAFWVPPSFAHVVVSRGIWRAGGVAVPLAVSHPPAELEHVIRDSAAGIVVADDAFAAAAAPLARAARARFVLTTKALAGAPAADLPHLASDRRAMIVYTSGTTGKPKGAVSTHQTIGAQISSLVSAWGWSPSDRLLLVLPLHHVHGIINGLGSALAVRATCEIAPAFDAEAVWERLASGEITVFTAVPTIYSRLAGAWDAAAPPVRRRWSEGVSRLRLMMSGSAALPIQMLERWRAISGHT